MNLRNLPRKNFSKGKFEYLVIFDLPLYGFNSNKYDLYDSRKKLKPFVSLKEKKQIKAHNRKFSLGSQDEIPILQLDELEDDLKSLSIGKTWMNFKSRRTKPLYVYFTDKEDLIIPLSKYHEYIFRIYKISPKS